MNPDPIRWVAMKGPGNAYQVFSGPQSRLDIQDIPEQQQMGYETVAMVDSEAEAWQWVEIHRARRAT